MTELHGTQQSEALHLVCHLNRALHLDGDVCEFGIAQGATSALIANEIRETDKRLWLFDSFEGLPKPTNRDILIDDVFNLGAMEKYRGTMACGQDQVMRRLNAIQFPLDRVTIVPGFIEKTSKYTSLPKTVCFAYVDFDLYEPIKIALELLDARLPVGGIAIIDDYGFFSAGAQAAVDEFVEARGPRYEKRPSPDWASKFCVLRRSV
jgi:O-methyltransferase